MGEGINKPPLIYLPIHSLTTFSLCQIIKDLFILQIGGVKFDIDHQGMSISNRELYREHWRKEIRAWIQQIKRANLTFRQLRARLLRSGFTDADIQEVIDVLSEIGYDLEDYTK